MAQLSLSPINAAQPLRDAMDKMNVRLQRKVLEAGEYRAPRAHAEEQEQLLQRLERGGHEALMAVEDFVSGVETLLQPPAGSWQQEEVNFLLNHSGKLYAKVRVTGLGACL